MTDQSAQEPTMEEILASIRRIISEDDTPAPEAAAPEPAPAPEPVPAPAPEPAPVAAAPSPALMDETPSVQQPAASEEDVLELTDLYEAPASETIGDLDVTTPEPEPAPTAWTPPTPELAPTPAAPAPTGYDSLVGDSAAASAASAFAGLAASFSKPEPITDTGGTGPTIDDLARALLRPMLKDWLDANLPGIVETAVRKEVERIARTAG